MRQTVKFCRADDGVGLAYAIVGRGPPLLYVCGWPEHLEGEWEQPFARSFLSGLARGCSLIRYDMRGSGLSDRDVDDLSFERLLQDLVVVANQLGSAPVHVLSLGMLGGPLAVEFAARRPERVRRLAIVGGVLRGADVMDGSRRRRLVDYVSEFGFPHLDFVAADGVDSDAARGVRDLQRRGAAPPVQAAVLREFFAADLSMSAAAVRAATLVVHADQDPLVPHECGRQLAAAIPSATFLTVPNDSAAPWAMQQLLLPRLADFFGFDVVDGDAARTIGHLTIREREVLGLMAEGLSNRDVASALTVSEKTIKTHVSNVLAKLGARNRADAVAIGLRCGLIES